MADGNQGDQQCSFGIKKIVDCKIDQTGKQLYKVKWEATWEPADSLSSCQHLIDEFWGFVNKAKTNEDIAQQHRKRMRLDPSAGQNGTVGLGPHHMLSEDSKDEVQRLIARTNATQPGSLMTPSDLLNTQQNQMGVPRTPTRAPQSPFAQNTRMPFSQSPGQFNQQQQQFGSPQTGFPNQSPMSSPSTRGKAPGFGKPASNIKSEQDESGKKAKCRVISSSQSNSSSSIVSSLKYLENFSNPYVRLVVLCKICSKEQTMTSAGNWKQHYFTHVSEEEKPHRCDICHKGFITAPHLKKHLKQHEKKVKKQKEDTAFENHANIVHQLQCEPIYQFQQQQQLRTDFLPPEFDSGI
ncbi:zinc finger protein sens-like isoform X2 [Clytia hemisphaerica]|uniref:zinc finger protein sens-like isoform X2 n=1 Tax=Clytia hemisphaerica TaxID=252671 RepID=UPI0034D46E6A